MGSDSRIRWALIGAGVAGRARARAIGKDPRSRLVAVWRGRFAHEIGALQVATLQEALAACDAVAVCSPDAAHPEQVEAALSADRHVVVEFPLAPSRQRASELLELARERQRVLHVEHIELLDPVCQTLCAHLRPEWVRHLACSFERSGPDGADRDHLARSNVARLHRVTAVGGPVSRIDRIEHAPGRLEVDLLLASGATAACVFQQAGYFTRRTALEVESVDGARWRQENGALYRDRTPQTLLGMGNLFRRDHLHAMQRIVDGEAPYLSDARLLHVLDVVDRLAAGTVGDLTHRA
jgi:biliverdin reductase